MFRLCRPLPDLLSDEVANYGFSFVGWVRWQTNTAAAAAGCARTKLCMPGHARQIRARIPTDRCLRALLPRAGARGVTARLALHQARCLSPTLRA